MTLIRGHLVALFVIYSKTNLGNIFGATAQPTQKDSSLSYQRPKAAAKPDAATAKTAAKSGLPSVLHTTRVELYKQYVVMASARPCWGSSLGRQVFTNLNEWPDEFHWFPFGHLTAIFNHMVIKLCLPAHLRDILCLPTSWL